MRLKELSDRIKFLKDNLSKDDWKSFSEYRLRHNDAEFQRGQKAVLWGICFMVLTMLLALSIVGWILHQESTTEKSRIQVIQDTRESFHGMMKGITEKVLSHEFLDWTETVEPGDKPVDRDPDMSKTVNLNDPDWQYIKDEMGYVVARVPKRANVGAQQIADANKALGKVDESAAALKATIKKMHEVDGPLR